MTLVTEKETRTYKEGKWRIDIEKDKYMYNAWIYHTDYGIKYHMLGIVTTSHTFEEMLEMTITEFEINKKIYEERFIR